jgi:hypothetical protein
MYHAPPHEETRVPASNHAPPHEETRVPALNHALPHGAPRVPASNHALTHEVTLAAALNQSLTHAYAPLKFAPLSHAEPPVASQVSHQETCFGSYLLTLCGFVVKPRLPAGSRCQSAQLGELGMAGDRRSGLERGRLFTAAGGA